MSMQTLIICTVKDMILPAWLVPTGFLKAIVFGTHEEEKKSEPSKELREHIYFSCLFSKAWVHHDVRHYGKKSVST